MKVLITVDNLVPPAVEVSGIKYVYSLQKELVGQGIEISVVTSVDKWADRDWEHWIVRQEKEHNIKFYIVNNWFKRFPRIYFYLVRFLIFFKTLSVLRRNKFDFVHEYSSLPLLINRTWLLGKLTGVKTVHTLCTQNKGLLSSGKLVFGKVDKVICSNRVTQKTFNSTAPYLAKYIPSGISITDFLDRSSKRDYRVELDIPSGVPIVLYVGLLDKRKGIFSLVRIIPRVLEKHPDIVFVIATRYQDDVAEQYVATKEYILGRIAPFSKNVRLIEGIHNISALMHASDIFVFPITTLFGTLGTPATLVEAMACGCAIVATKHPFLSEFIQDNRTGLLYSDSTEFVRSICSFIDDPSLRGELGLRGAKEAQRYSLSCIASSVVDVYYTLYSRHM